jgi:hypothetical protein
MTRINTLKILKARTYLAGLADQYLMHTTLNSHYQTTTFNQLMLLKKLTSNLTRMTLQESLREADV